MLMRVLALEVWYGTGDVLTQLIHVHVQHINRQLGFTQSHARA